MNLNLLGILFDALNAVSKSNSLDDEIVDLKQRISEHAQELDEAYDTYRSVSRGHKRHDDDDVRAILGTIGGE